MKVSKQIFIAVLVIMAYSGTSYGQTVEGDGDVIKETRSISSFSEIQIAGVLNVFLSQGNTEEIVVETDRNLMNYVDTYVSDNNLIIKNSDEIEIKKKTKMNIYVTLKDIKKIKIEGVGNVKTVNTLNITKLDLENSGVGNIQLDLNCDKLMADINSVGGVTLSGRVDEVSIDHNGVGNVKAFDLSAGVLKIQSNGVGNSEVNSENEIYLNLNGIGNITYKGSAIVKELNVNGRGKIQKM